MTSLNNLESITFDQIETDIMSVLYANMNTNYSQYSLFSKLLSDKYDVKHSAQIHPNFKSKFLLILRILMTKYDDIKVTKNNNLYNIVCSTDTIFQPVFSKPETNLSDDKFTDDKFIDNESNDFASMYDYIYENNLIEYMVWSDPWDGNSIYHELVKYKNLNQIQKLINLNQFDFYAKNKNGQTPIEMSKSVAISNTIAMGMLIKFSIEKEQDSLLITNYKNKLNNIYSFNYSEKIIEDTSIFKFITIKSLNFYKNNKAYIVFALICSVIIKYLFIK